MLLCDFIGCFTFPELAQGFRLVTLDLTLAGWGLGMLLGTDWAASLFLSTNSRRNHSSAHLGTIGSFLSEGVFTGRIPLIIECSLIHGHGKGQEN